MIPAPAAVLAVARETLEKEKGTTPGPWRFEKDGEDEWLNSPFGLLADISGFSNENAVFIAHCRTAAPALAAEVIRLHEATCATCQHFRRETAETQRLGYCYKGINSDAIASKELPETFGCTLHEPVAARVRAEEEEGAATQGPEEPTSDELRQAIETVVRGFDEGVFVRATDHDHTSSWMIKLMPFLAALAILKRAVNER